MAPTGGGAARAPKGGAALREASAAGDAPAVDAILRATGQAFIDETDENGCTALQRASADGHSEVVRLLMQNGVDPNRQDSVHGNTALHEAAWKGYSRCVALLATKAALHIRNNGGFAPLHLACQNGHNQTCREILLAGCDPDIQNNYGDTSLHTSARYGHAGVTRILISAECHVSDQNKNGDTPLHIAAAMGRRKLTRILLEAGCDRTLKNKQSETAKDIAVRKDLHEIVEILGAASTSGKSHKKESKSKTKTKTKDQRRDKSVERSVDTPDAAAAKSKRRSRDLDKYKEKRKVKSVHFEGNGVHWSPYGCHYYPDPKSFPKPKLDSLPKEPLKKGEQYYLDLAGNICKGPVGIGYTCYCAPFFRHMEDKLNRDKLEIKHHIDKAHEKLDLKVSNLERKTQGQISELTRCVAAERVLCRERQQHLEHWLTRGMMFRASERARKLEPDLAGGSPKLKRTRSLEMLERTSKAWHIIKSLESNRASEAMKEKFDRSMRTASRSADVLDFNESTKSNRSETKSIGKVSERSLSGVSHGTEITRRSNKKYSSGRDSTHNVTAEIHTRSPSIHDILSQSEAEERQSNKSSMRNKESMVSKNDRIEGIETDGYIKIARCDDASRSQLESSDVGINVDGSSAIESGPRRSVHELVARIQERQLIEEIQRASRSPTRSPSRACVTPGSRPTSPNYPTNFTPASGWQNNTIPLSESTDFNTIEPILNQTVVQQQHHTPNSNNANSTPPQHGSGSATKSSKKFSFHNLIPFPTRKMFNFHNSKSSSAAEGNQSESSDDEDAPVRSPLEPGLMQNSNLLTTLPLPNYENMAASNQAAQPQSPNKNDPLSDGIASTIPIRSNILPIPKDAYFHEIPNRQRSQDPRIPSQYVHPHFKTPYAPISRVPNNNNNNNGGINYGRNRNPVYNPNGLLGEMLHDHIDRELDRNAEIEVSNINGCSDFHHGHYKAATDPMMMMRAPINHHAAAAHYQPLHSHHPMNELPAHHHLHAGMQNLAINTHLTELQSQLDRDSHNDSGYSTKVYGSSQGASPSLSGNVECLEAANLNQKLGLAMSRSLATPSASHPGPPPPPHSHIGASSLV